MQRCGRARLGIRHGRAQAVGQQRPQRARLASGQARHIARDDIERAGDEALLEVDHGVDEAAGKARLRQPLAQRRSSDTAKRSGLPDSSATRAARCAPLSATGPVAL